MPFAEDLLAEQLLDAALRLFRERGFQQVSLADIATAAGRPLDDLFRHYARKEQFVFRLYEQLAADLETIAAELPAGSLADRASAVLRRKLELVAPHVELFRPLLAAALDPTAGLAVLGRQTNRIRERVQAVFAAAVLGASDAPPAEDARRVVRILYTLHLGCVGLLMQDQTPGRELAAEGALLFNDMARLAGSLGKLERGGWLAKLAANSLGAPDLAGLADRVDRLTSRLIQPPHDASHFTLAENLLRDLMRHRRLQPGAGACGADPCPQCLALHLPLVHSALQANAPVRLVLPAFPAKSASRSKTLGPLPDLGEELALRFLQERCDAIRERYPPGARLTICSDGRVFNDLVGVSDADVTAYRQRISELISRLGLTDIDLFDLDDVWPGEPYADIRERLLERHGEPLERLIERTHQFPHHQQLYNGIHRFLTEDLADREPGLSRNQARNRSKDAAYEVVRRSNAWSRLVAVYFPEALRLSIHPQPPHSEKIGIQLVAADDVWLTPWHSVAVLESERFRLMHRAAAEQLGARLVEADGRPSHYEALSPAKAPDSKKVPS